MNPAKRKQYRDEVAKIARDKLVFLDESGIELNLCKERGWSKKGHLLSAPKRGQREKRLNVMGALNGKRVLAPVWFREA